MSIETGPGLDFLREKYKLQSEPEVKSAAKRTERRTREALPQDPKAQIQNYLDRFKEITEREKPEERERLLSTLKNILHNRYVIKAEEIPEGYYQNIIQRHAEEGRPIEEIPEDIKAELAQTLVKDQENSLDLWVDYLASDEAKYPDWLKYWAFRKLLVMGRYDKEKKRFTERSKSGKSVSPFPDLNREALGYVFDAMEKKQTRESITFRYDIQPDEQNEFRLFLDRGNFSNLYAWSIEKINPIDEEMLKITDGEWRSYPKGSDHLQLASSLANYGTGWCIRGESTAKRYLSESSLEIFYSLDENNEPKIPRVVIITQDDNRISEVRGVAEQENLDPYIGNVVSQKLAELPDGKAYEKRSSDMKFLTAIDNKVKAGQELDRDELVFLYEINSTIEGFGYERDPRIAELKSQRNPKEDAPIVLACQPEEIAWNQNEISPKSKAYVGPLFPGIFSKLGNIEHTYTSFPEGRIQRSELEIGGRTARELEGELRERNINITDYVQDMFRSPDFTTLKNPEKIELVRLKVSDLGFPSGATIDQIYERAQELGLELCPAEVGPYQRLKDINQPMNEWYWIAMKQIPDRFGNPGVFYLTRGEDGLWLRDDWASPRSEWNLDCELLFRLRKDSLES